MGGVGAAVLFAVWTAWRFGGGIDQSFDQQFLINNLHEWGVVDRFAGGFSSAAQQQLEESYGFTFHMIAFVLEWIYSSLRGDTFDPFSASAYSHRNALIALLSTAAFWAVFHATRSLTGRRHIAIAATGLLALMPVFTGHALMNQKDMTLAVGFTTLTAGTIAVVGRLTRRTATDAAALTTRFGSRWSAGVLLGLGLSFTVGSRPASIIAVSIDLALLAAVAIASKTHRSWPELRAPVIGLATGTTLVLITNPAALPNPVSWLLRAIDVSREFPWRADILVDGRFHDSALQPRWYLPYMLAVQTPLVIAALGVTAIWFLVVRTLERRDRRHHLLLWTPALVQMLVLPLGGVLQGSLFYNAARQALFVLPMMAILAAVGLMALDQLVTGRRARIAVASILAIGALSPLVDTVTLYPYQYVYYGELVRTPDLTDRFEFDYWGLSARELQGWVNEHYPTAVEVYPYMWLFPTYGNGTITFAQNWEGAGDREKIFAANYYPSWKADEYFDCPVVHRVTRHLWTSEILLGYVRRCTGVR